MKERIENKDSYKDFNAKNKEEKARVGNTKAIPSAKKKFTSFDKINLTANLQENIKCQENGGYKYQMEINNLKEMSKTLNFLMSNNMKNADKFLAKHGEINVLYSN